ncbi:MAG: hypothetical protein K1X88_01570 [Nannocystaceae bacterium]|nr:hypothetical protein [Nannocystaceae bacterium]
MRAPSTNWREQVAPDEDERFARYAQGLVAAQRKRSAAQGEGRALHRKQVLALAGELEVAAGLPAHASHGLFASPGRHEVLVRLSNGAMERSSDRRPDVRGFSFKVFGVKGPNALGSGETTSQDFTMINHDKFSAAKAAEFAELVLALDRGPLAVLGHLVRTYGFFGALRHAKAAKAVITKPFTGFATERFSTVLPLCCGPYAMRARLLPPGGEPRPDARDDWAADLRGRLERGPLSYRMQAQFFVDEAITPIEDASVDWPESEAPWIDVATLTIAPQSFDDEAAKARQAKAEQGIFDPWNALAEHRPLGDVMRARKVAYYASQKARGVA